ncbi:MAG TPA: hypothetical protein VF157_07615, partial [Chloroflexota bacterium]
MDVALDRARFAEDAAQQEKAYAAEKSSAGIRLAIVVFNGLTYPFVLDPTTHVVWLAYTLLGIAFVYSLYVVAAQPYRKYPAMQHAYFTSGLDALLIALWLFATGGFES